MMKMKLKKKLKLKNNIIIFIISTCILFQHAYYFNMHILFNNYETKYNIL